MGFSGYKGIEENVRFNEVDREFEKNEEMKCDVGGYLMFGNKNILFVYNYGFAMVEKK